MKKIFVSSFVALALALVAVPANAAFSAYLTVGSTGADVSALQTWLIANNYAIPAISSGAAQKGYFGQQTKAAVVKYQAAIGLPATGFVGPLTIAKLNGTGGVLATTPACNPVYFNCTPVGGVVPPVVVTPGAAFVADGTDGSISLSTNSYVASTQTLKKGDLDKPVISMTAKSVNGNVQVSRFDIHFSARPWLLFSRVTLKNAVTGQVLAVKTLSSISDTTEVTVNSDYLVRFDNVNTTVGSSDVTFVVTADVLAASDKITGQTITVSSDANGVRTINGKGYTDSTGVAITNSVVLSSTGGTGDLLTQVGLTTPATRTESVSTTNVTADQVLGVFDLKLQNKSGTVSELNINVNSSMAGNVSGSTLLATNVFQNFRLYSGSTLIGGAYTVSAANPAVVRFVNLTLPLEADMWKTITLKADVLATSTAFSASSTLDVTSTLPAGIDSNYSTITLTNAADRTANNVTFVPNAGLKVDSFTRSDKSSVTITTSSVWASAKQSLSFKISNTGSNAIYISKTASTVLATSTTLGANASTTVEFVTASGDTTGDTSASYIINSGGSRTFTYRYAVDNTNGTAGSKKISITQVNYGTGAVEGTSSGQNAALNVNYGLDEAYVLVP